ncbi:MAG: YezD family protein [Treponema sp.]|nr:YezD family protein [Treponema sp.]
MVINTKKTDVGIRESRSAEVTAYTEEYPPEFEKIAEYIKSIKFGSVIIQIQDGKIIQLDKTEKFRFDRQ